MTITAGGKRRARQKETIQVWLAFALLRHLPRHLLLAELRKHLLLQLCGSSRVHYEGLSVASKALNPGLSRQTINRLKAKLRLIDDAHHLLEHLSPESATEFCCGIDVALPSSAEGAKTNTGCTVDQAGTQTSDCECQTDLAFDTGTLCYFGTWTTLPAPVDLEHVPPFDHTGQETASTPGDARPGDRDEVHIFHTDGSTSTQGPSGEGMPGKIQKLCGGERGGTWRWGGYRGWAPPVHFRLHPRPLPPAPATIAAAAAAAADPAATAAAAGPTGLGQ